MVYYQFKLPSFLRPLFLATIFFTSTLMAVAQEAPDFSDNDIEEFVEANKKVAEVQQENQTAMIKVIEEENLEVERFNEIMQAQQSQDVNNEDIRAEEMVSFQKAAQEVMVIQNQMQEKIEYLLDGDMGAEKYRQMMLAYQSDPVFQQKVDDFIKD